MAQPPWREPHAGQNQAWRQLRTSLGGRGLAPTSTEPGLRGFRCRALGSTVTLARSWGKSHLLAVQTPPASLTTAYMRACSWADKSGSDI